MSGLELPTQLAGPWSSLLILTYGADLAFFENALSRQLKDSCRNRVILCDGGHYQALCEEQKNQQLRHLNLRYLTAGMYMPGGVAHAKILLLLSAEEGRLLVGSGNLGMPGYARNAELFTQYECRADDRGDLPEFRIVRELVDALAERGYVHEAAQHQIREMWNEAAWLVGPLEGESRVRHNLDRSFLDQLSDAVAGRRVRELVAAAPFFDEHARALNEALDRLQPERVRVLLQKGSASVDPEALLGVLRDFPGRGHVELFDVTEGPASRYAHAKLLLARLDDADVCLQGSPNLSQVAMTRAGAQANLEVANLLVGAPGDFDGLLEMLECERAGKPESWGIKYLRPATQALPGTPGCRLLGGEWDGKCVILDCTMPEQLREPLSLVFDGKEVPVEVVRADERRVWLTAPEQLPEALGSPLPVAVAWQGEGSERLLSNAIVLCVQPALQSARQYRPEGQRLPHIGALDLDDEEIEELLLEMEKTLVIDRADVFRAAGKTEAFVASAAEDTTAYSLDELDRQAVLDHPRLRKYLRGRTHDHAVDDGLAGLLTAITSQFRGLAPATGPVIVPNAEPLPDTDSEDEILEDQQEQRERSAAAERRAWRQLKAFVRRFVRGLTNPEFAEFVGPFVVATNYRVLLHFVTVLLAKAQDKDEWEPPWLAEQLSLVLQWYWGDEEAPGFFRGVKPEYREPIAKDLEESATGAGLLVALVAAGDVAREHHLDETLDRLASVSRRLLIEPPLPWPVAVVEEAMRACGAITANPPESEAELELELQRTLDWESRESFLHRQVERYQVKPYQVYFDDQHLSFGFVPTLAIEGKGAWASTAMEETLADFMRFRPASDYSIRLLTADGDKVATLVCRCGGLASCVVRDHKTSQTSPLPQASPAVRPWDAPLRGLFLAAA